MNDHKLMKALSCIDPKYIQEGELEGIPQPARHSPSRLAVVLLAACLVFALAITAYAANLFGIRELFGTYRSTIPESAIPYIQPETVATEAKTGWSCGITESLCDYATAMVTVTISGGDQYIIAPTDVNPTDYVNLIGLPGDQTLEEYAASQGKKLLMVGASIKEIGGQPTGDSSQRMENLSDSEMIILTQCSKTVSTPTLEAVCMVYAREAGSSEVQRVELPFTLTEAPASAEGTILYRTDMPDAIPGMTVGDLQVTQTPLGINLQMLETVTDEEDWYHIMKVEIDGLTFVEGYSTGLEDDGNLYFKANMCQGTLGDTLVVRFYDWDKVFIGEMTFRRVG